MSRFLSFFAVVAALTAAAVNAEPQSCNGTTTQCPLASNCCSAQYSPTKYGCMLNGACCLPGPPNPPSTTLPNALVIGDSVSIGYTPFAVKALAGKCALQHGPWDVSDGGAATTGYAQACLNNWLVTQRQQSVKWDVILFNSGLHNLDNSSAAEQLYEQQLHNVTARLHNLTSSGTKLIYALTTPFMPDHTVGNMVVEQLNAIATDIMKGYNIPILDLYSIVTDHCGKNYTTCDWCRVEPCSYHYNPEGESVQGDAVAAAIRKLLP